MPQVDPIDVARYIQEKSRARRDAEIKPRVARMFEVASEDTPERRRKFDELLDFSKPMRDPEKQEDPQS